VIVKWFASSPGASQPASNSASEPSAQRAIAMSTFGAGNA
jgi:hypothetical protein